MTDLIQVTSRSGNVRGPAHSYQPPDLIQINLGANQRVAQVDWSRGREARNRKTVDWTWTLWVETRLTGVES